MKASVVYDFLKRDWSITPIEGSLETRYDFVQKRLSFNSNDWTEEPKEEIKNKFSVYKKNNSQHNNSCYVRFQSGVGIDGDLLSMICRFIEELKEE